MRFVDDGLLRSVRNHLSRTSINGRFFNDGKFILARPAPARLGGNLKPTRVLFYAGPHHMTSVSVCTDHVKRRHGNCQNDCAFCRQQHGACAVTLRKVGGKQKEYEP